MNRPAEGSNEPISTSWKIVISIIIVLLLSGAVWWGWGLGVSWTDTGSVTWLSIGQKTFHTEPSGLGAISFWYTPYSFAVTTLAHGSFNFTDRWNLHPCSYCRTDPNDDFDVLKLAVPVGLVGHNNNSVDLNFDP